MKSSSIPTAWHRWCLVGGTGSPTGLAGVGVSCAYSCWVLGSFCGEKMNKKDNQYLLNRTSIDISTAQVTIVTRRWQRIIQVGFVHMKQRPGLSKAWGTRMSFQQWPSWPLNRHFFHPNRQPAPLQQGAPVMGMGSNQHPIALRPLLATGHTIRPKQMSTWWVHDEYMMM